MLLDAGFLEKKFGPALAYADFVALGEPMGHRPPWDQRHAQLELTDPQRRLVESFSRSMKVLCLTGTWCGDCALQGAAMARVAEAAGDRVDLRFLLRHEDHADIITRARINAGFRVPVTWFMAEDFEPVIVFGDRTLSRYRSMARKQLPPDRANVLAPPPQDPVREVLAEVLDLFERAHLLLRLSPRWRQVYGD